MPAERLDICPLWLLSCRDKGRRRQDLEAAEAVKEDCYGTEIGVFS